MDLVVQIDHCLYGLVECIDIRIIFRRLTLTLILQIKMIQDLIQIKKNRVLLQINPH